jgi:hypothetical protein
MPHFYFHLRSDGTVHRDADGTDLPDLTAAREHALAVAEELMLHSEPRTRHWSLCVEGEGGRPQFDLFFADVDKTLAAYAPQLRMLVTETCRRLAALNDALCAARATRMETRMLLARARRRPHLVYAKGEQ